MTELSVVDVTAENVDTLGFFCVKNKKHPGYVAKRAWLEQRFTEGMRIKLLRGGDGSNYGFIEYTPGEYTFRTVEAPGYLVIHCIWVDSKKLETNDNSRYLIQSCLEDAKDNGFAGIAVVTSDGSWMADRKGWLKYGFKIVDEAEPHYQLMIRAIADSAPPRFPTNWSERLQRGNELELLFTSQCPYIGKGIQELPPVAEQHGITLKITEFDNPVDARNSMASPYGMFNIIHEGKLLADHPISATRFKNILQKDLGLKKVN